MFWSILSNYPASSFKRATGLHKPVFLALVQIVADYKALRSKSPRRGKESGFEYRRSVTDVVDVFT
jgi:hypothetical protein